MIIDARGLTHKELNGKIRDCLPEHTSIHLENVMGQRYIGCGLKDPVAIDIDGIPGNDLAAFMNGALITVHGNVQDGIGNTMNAGRVIARGDAGDILGHSMRGGRIYVAGNVGYRTGIHMKSFKDRFPIIVIGGSAGDYLGEYMAGGMIMVLGLNEAGEDGNIAGRHLGAGMHGGAIYIAGGLDESRLCPEPARSDITGEEKLIISEVLKDYMKTMEISDSEEDSILDSLVKYVAISSRPYGKLYAY